MSRSTKIFLLSAILIVFPASLIMAAYPVGDLDGNCEVNFEDLRLFIAQWLDAGGCSGADCADLNGTDGVNASDFALLADSWRQYSYPLDGTVIKRVDITQTVPNILNPGAWLPYEEGFVMDGDFFLCDNGTDSEVYRGVRQTVTLNQTSPQPIVAAVWSKAEDVGGSRNNDYSLYLDIIYNDDTPLWGQTAKFNVGTHDWERREVIVFPEKPIKRVYFYMLLRRHSGKAWFRDPELGVLDGVNLFDGLAVMPEGSICEGFQLRDVAADSNYVRIENQALGVHLDYQKSYGQGATFFDVTLSDTTGNDRAVTLLYSIPIWDQGWRWLHDPRQSITAEPQSEYMNTKSFDTGANGRLSRYPFAAIANATSGLGLGIDMACPAFSRAGYNSSTNELFLAYDIGLTPEKPTATVRFCRFDFDPQWDFRAALARFYEIFPHHFLCRTPEQGIWMPFTKISTVAGWEDFGFKFKESNNETDWDDAHDIITFHYTEPHTWWMYMPPGMPRTFEAALNEAMRLAVVEDNIYAKSLLASGLHDEAGQFVAQLIDAPWNDGAVWSINSMPGVLGEFTGFKNKWNPTIVEQLYGPGAVGDLDGEYIDSSEGYVTAELNFRRDHFATTETPLTFSLYDRRPAIFRGITGFEYIRAISNDMHAMGKLMMANGTPSRLCWYAPLLDVMGTETDWNRNAIWSPMSDTEMLYRRAMCKGKPYCFLMNTAFEDFGYDLVEKYMKRSLAYGMFPGFFSHNASGDKYFTRPELYNRDRPLFLKYIPLCKLVAEAGWEPITLATSSDESVYVERFGDRYLTVFNDSTDQRIVTITVETEPPGPSHELVADQPVVWSNGQTTLTLDGEDVAVIQLY